MTMAAGEIKYFDDKLDELKKDVKESIEKGTQHIREIVEGKIASVETGVKLNRESIQEIKLDQKEINNKMIAIDTSLTNHKENHQNNDTKKRSNIGYIITISLFALGWILTIFIKLKGA